MRTTRNGLARPGADGPARVVIDRVVLRNTAIDAATARSLGELVAADLTGTRGAQPAPQGGSDAIRTTAADIAAQIARRVRTEIAGSR